MSVNFDSTFGFDPAVQDSSMAARGLYATMVTWCDHQIYTRPDSFDGHLRPQARQKRGRHRQTRARTR